MNIQKMIPKHSKCGKELLIRFFFLTSNGELMLKGVCSGCKEKDIEIYLPLDDLKADCPPPPMNFTIMDGVILHGMGVRLPDQREIQ